MRSILLLFVVIVTINASNAQVNKGSLTFQAAFPVADYKGNYNIIPTGLLFNFTHQLKNQPPFCFGGEIGILQVSGADKYYTGFYDNEYNTFLIASWNHIVTAGAIFEVSLFPENSFFDVDVNISAGTNIFITTASVSRDDGWDWITNTAHTKYYFTDNHTSLALRMGGGVKVEIPFGRKKKICALIKGSYLYGSHAKYYGQPHITDAQIILSPRSSGTSMLLAETGLRFNMFDNNKNKKDEN